LISSSRTFAENKKSTTTTMSGPKVENHVSGNWVIGYVCDLEGNWTFWTKYVQSSKVVKRDINNELELQDNCILVVGGDICDRGNGDIRILRDLISLKNRYRDQNRVFFILGNRDVNKLRLPVTLSDAVLAHRPECYWVNASTIDADYKVDDIVDKLKWTLKHTMGSPFSFECRKQEMLEFVPGLVIDDAMISADYLKLILPGGLLFNYVKEASMAVIIGDTIFVHGAITTYNNNKLG
jgi:hypothetical protein